MKKRILSFFSANLQWLNWRKSVFWKPIKTGPGMSHGTLLGPYLHRVGVTKWSDCGAKRVSASDLNRCENGTEIVKMSLGDSRWILCWGPIIISLHAILYIMSLQFLIQIGLWPSRIWWVTTVVPDNFYTKIKWEGQWVKNLAADTLHQHPSVGHLVLDLVLGPWS